MRHHLQQPLVVNRVKETCDVGIEHPVHALAHDRCMQCIPGHVRVASWPEAIGETRRSPGLIDGTEHFSDRALDDLSSRAGTPSAVFRHRLWECKHAAPAVAVATRVDSIAEIMEILLQSFFVLRHSHPIDTCAACRFCRLNAR